MPVAPDDGPPHVSPLAHRALDRLVASMAQMSPLEVVWVKTFLSMIVADNDETIDPPDGARDVLLHVASVIGRLRPDVPNPPKEARDV